MSGGGGLVVLRDLSDRLLRNINRLGNGFGDRFSNRGDGGARSAGGAVGVSSAGFNLGGASSIVEAEQAALVAQQHDRSGLSGGGDRHNNVAVISGVASTHEGVAESVVDVREGVASSVAERSVINVLEGACGDPILNASLRVADGSG